MRARRRFTHEPTAATRRGAARALATRLAWLLLLVPVGLGVLRDWPVSPSRLPAVPSPVEQLLFGGKLDLNHADAGSLELLPSLGPTRSAAIVAERVEGAYCELRDLTRASGIGPVTLRRVAPWLEVAMPPVGCKSSVD